MRRRVRRESPRRFALAVALFALGSFGSLTMCSNGHETAAPADDDGGRVSAEAATVATDATGGDAIADSGANTADSSASTFSTCAMTGPPSSVDDPDATFGIVPMSVVDVKGDTRFAVWVSLNGTPVLAMLDTGAAGVRVLASTIADAGLTALDSGPLEVRYNGGLVLTGYAASADVGLQGLDNPIADVPIQVVTSACELQFGTLAPDGSTPCTPTTPNIFGMSATIGIGLRQSRTVGGVTLRSPLASIPGYPPFVIHLNGTSASVGDDAGTIEVGVTDQERATFPYWIRLTGGPAPVWNDLSVQSCVRDETADGGCWTQGTFLDTGDTNPYIESDDSGAPTPGAFWPASDTAQIELLGAGGCVMSQYTVPASTVAVRKLAPGTSTDNNVGYGVFYRVDVLYDPAGGWIGLRPRP